MYSSKQKLKPELAGLPGNVIRDRRLAGEVGALEQLLAAHGLHASICKMSSSTKTCRG